MLKESSGLLDRIQEVADIGGWQYNVATDSFRATAHLYSILEMPEGTPFDLETGLGFFVPESREEVRIAVQTCIEEGTPFDLEVPIVTAQGTRKWTRL